MDQAGEKICEMEYRNFEIILLEENKWKDGKIYSTQMETKREKG